MPRGIVFAFPFVRWYVRSLLSVTLLEFTSKFLVKVSLSEYVSLTTHQKAFLFEPWVPERVKVSLSEYISLTTHQKAFLFEPWVPERVILYAMSFGPRVHAPGWG